METAIKILIIILSGVVFVLSISSLVIIPEKPKPTRITVVAGENKVYIEGQDLKVTGSHE